MPVMCLGPRQKAPPGFTVVNATSRAKDNWQTDLSPFFLGPCPLYGGQVARNMENGWQFSKVYKEHLSPDGNPSQLYFAWARTGWADQKAYRYPMGKGRKPEYSWWDGEKLSYVEARKKIYLPMYARAVVKTEGYRHLQAMYQEDGMIALWDFDAYDHRALGMSYDEVINCPERKMGHSFVLAMLLDGHPAAMAAIA